MVFAGINKEETLAGVMRIIYSIIAIVIIVMVFCAVVVSLIANSMSKALKRVLKTSNRYLPEIWNSNLTRA